MCPRRPIIIGLVLQQLAQLRPLFGEHEIGQTHSVER